MRFKEKPYRRLCFSVPGEGTVVKMSALNWKPFVYGGLASITAECGTFPIDLTKTRLQIQGQTNDANFKEIRYRGMLHALVRIGKEEGLKALYSGIAPAMLRQASYGTIKIGIYQSLKRLFVEHPEDETLLINVVCGILSGVVSSTIANPTDVLKIRMQAQSSTFQGGMIGNFINIYQQEGARGLWKLKLHLWSGWGAGLQPRRRCENTDDESESPSGWQVFWPHRYPGLLVTEFTVLESLPSAAIARASQGGCHLRRGSGSWCEGI
uniref:kidney mitochondrial carrier protein 1 isoform X5 n=1 Tax=Halichoerus grypus TaxID=9711 RepID=UPI0016591577|nr:kidney mitochondrial carrier protein 1 isoform X5 [Halichoerus grypus]